MDKDTGIWKNILIYEQKYRCLKEYEQKYQEVSLSLGQSLNPFKFTFPSLFLSAP